MMVSSPSRNHTSPMRESKIASSLGDDSASDWQQKMNMEGMLEEVVEDALELEDQKVAATKAMNALTDKAVSMHTKALVYDERLRTMRTFFIIQSICGLILASLILYIHSVGVLRDHI